MKLTTPIPEDHQELRLVCAWCSTVVRPGTGRESHGICAPCRHDFEQAWEAARTRAPR